MPHGRLTPLGKQLRSELANLSNTRPTTGHRCIRPELRAQLDRSDNGSPSLSHHVHLICGRRSIASAAAIHVDPRREGNFDPLTRPRGTSARVVRRRTRIDHVSSALNAVGKESLLGRRPSQKPDLTYVHPKKQQGYRQAAINRRRHARVDGPRAPYLSAISLQSILAAYLKHQAQSVHRWTADRDSQYQPSPREAQVLQQHGYSIQDVGAWADIIGEENAVTAAKKLRARNEAHGVLATPLFIYLKLIHRPNISARALRHLVGLAWSIFTERSGTLVNPGIDNEPRFLAAIRLLRHAREVWPASMLSLARFVLDEPGGRSRKLESDEHSALATKTFRLNKFMSLISLSTSEQPFKDNEYQEAALVTILRHMSDHQPPLHINRDGYRAVVRTQLAQRKAPTEQQWAELQALSWPPWKEDRTGMDALVTRELHGTSRAGQALLRMREAGYEPRLWEQIAQMYAGWDVDHTPTIQTRVRLDLPGRRLSGRSKHLAESLIWAARITCTRTVQEAWACYLAWEDKRLPVTQDVLLAIVSKLRAESRRTHIEYRTSEMKYSRSWPLLPGDMREISPLPPSTHLETYTRTLPPTLEEFYEDLRRRGIAIKDHVLAFFIRHTRTLPFGLNVLRAAIPDYPGLRQIFSKEASPQLLELPLEIFQATIILFARFGQVPSFKNEVENGGEAHEGLLKLDPDVSHRLNSHSGIAHAVRLLRVRRAGDQSSWHAVFDGLSRKVNIHHFADTLMEAYSGTASNDKLGTDVSATIRFCAGCCVAYNLARHVRSMQAEQRTELGPAGFYRLCHVWENRAESTWRMLQIEEAHASDLSKIPNAEAFKGILHAAKNMFTGGNRDIRKTPVKLFHQLVGLEDHHVNQPDLPRLLVVPSPALLHAFVRVLGWLGQYTDLQSLIQWMRTHHRELHSRQKNDRNGEEMMRRVLIAMRVFLERSFLPESHVPRREGVLRLSPLNALANRSKELRAFLTPASSRRVEQIRAIVDSVEEWGGWPSEEEVAIYAQHKCFRAFSEYERNRMDQLQKASCAPLSPEG